MSDAGFTGRVALVAGGGGMGQVIARELTLRGARVAVADLKPAPAHMETGAGLLGWFEGDLTDEAFVAGAVADTVAAGGRLDLLVNAAGLLWFGRDRSVVDMHMDDWQRVLAVNLTAPALAARHAVPAMRAAGGGAMVHIASIDALRGDDRPQDAYGAAKAGLLRLSRSLAIQFAADRIRSNAILPGPVETPMQARWDADPAAREALARVVPLGRIGRAEDIAAACLFLLSDAASWITGTELVVDGGLLARP